MNSAPVLNSDLKKFFELQILKRLFEDNFFNYVDIGDSNYNAIEIAERIFEITRVQGYSDFGVVYRSQMIDALQELIVSYKDICNRNDVLAARYPDLKFAILSGWREYRTFTDGMTGGTLKITGEVRIGVGRTTVDIQNEYVVYPTVYLVDRYNYNYRSQDLEPWDVQNNIVVWKDIVQGNPFLNFILTKPRSAVTPMRVVVSASTKQSFKPMPVPPPAPCPPHPGPHPQPYPPAPLPPPPFPPPFPPPYPQPPMPPIETVLIRQIVAERTVGGIRQGDVLPAGLSFTRFVEWLLSGEEPEPEPEPQTDYIYSSAVTVNSQPDGSEIASMTQTEISDTALASGISISCETHTGKGIFIAIPATYQSKMKWYADDGSTSVTAPEPYTVVVNGVDYLAYFWNTAYLIDMTLILKKNS